MLENITTKEQLVVAIDQVFTEPAVPQLTSAVINAFLKKVLELSGGVSGGGAAQPIAINFGGVVGVTEFRLPWTAALAATYGADPAFISPTVVVAGQLIYPDITFDYTPNNLSILFVFGPDPKSGTIYIR